MPSYNDAAKPRTQFALIHRSLLQSDELPLQSLVSDQRIAQIFQEEQISFGQDDDAVYTPAITLWGLLSQVFFKEEQRSCLAAVIRIAALGRTVSSTNTGAYCRARKQITGEVLRKISGAVAARALSPSSQAADHDDRPSPPPDAGIGPASEYAGGRLIMVDGLTVTAADTAENQAEYPQNPKQKEGLGFPILRGVVLICMRTGLLLDADIGPYSGKGTGETALLWKLLDVLRAGDILVADSYYCTYWLLAACRRRGVHVVMRNHHLRVELDIRAIKCTLGMDILRAKTPEMVRTELWSCLLVYNLIRESMLQAAQRSDRTCRSLSLTATLQLFGNLWLSNAIHPADAAWRELFLAHQITIQVGHRPGRSEPRANKRRPKILQLLTKPRHAAKAELELEAAA